MFPIFKINHVIDNKVKKIYVFVGNKEISNNDNHATINQKLKIFSEEEFSYINQNNVEVQYLNKSIHLDDTIIRIKEKLFKEIPEFDMSINEIYLFYLTKKIVDISLLYQEIKNTSNQDIIVINKLKLFLKNIVKSSTNLNIKEETLNSFEPSEDNIYDSLINLNIDWEQQLLIAQSLGNYVNTKNNYPYVANPFLLSNDEYLSREGENIISTLNNNSLFKFTPIFNNNIYLCSAKNCLEFNNSKDLSSDYTLKLYFPLLYKKNNITNLEELNTNKGNLKDADDGKLKKYYKSYNKRVDLLYRIFESSKDILQNKKTGIEYLHFTIKPLYQIKIPLEVIFKTFNSTENILLIKYNPGKRFENIFRLYTGNNISTTGAKIPSLYVDEGMKKRN